MTVGVPDVQQIFGKLSNFCVLWDWDDFANITWKTIYFGSIQIARPVREQLFPRTTVRLNSCSREQLLPDHNMTNHEML